jgi:DinB family protein
MALPPPIAELWTDLEAARAEVLAEADGLTQTQSEWKVAESEWSVGEILHHLILAEIATGKLTTKLVREAEAAGVLPAFPADYAVAPLPAWPGGVAEAPPVVWPEAGHPLAELLATMKATRERSRQSIEKVALTDPRRLVFKHFRLGALDLGQWWKLQAEHDRVHLAQLRDVKADAGFPRA